MAPTGLFPHRPDRGDRSTCPTHKLPCGPVSSGPVLLLADGSQEWVPLPYSRAVPWLGHEGWLHPRPLPQGTTKPGSRAPLSACPRDSSTASSPRASRLCPFVTLRLACGPGHVQTLPAGDQRDGEPAPAVRKPTTGLMTTMLRLTRNKARSAPSARPRTRGPSGALGTSLSQLPGGTATRAQLVPGLPQGTRRQTARQSWVVFLKKNTQK